MGNTKQPIMQRRTVMKALGAATGLGIGGTGTTAAYN